MDGVLLPLSLSFLVGGIVVGMLYVWKHRIRDDPKTIKLRFVSSLISGVISLILVRIFVDQRDDESFCDILGICLSKTSVLRDIFIPVAITALFFLGPLAVLRDTYTWDELKHEMRTEIPNIAFVRNYIVAPITEEFIFRSVIFSFLRQWNNPWLIVSISSIVFSFAHSHHYFLRNVQGYRSMPISNAMIQIGYTFLFGSYSGSFFYKTHNFLSCISLHIFCNFLGFPDIETLIYCKRYLYPTVAGIIAWLVVYPLYLYL